MNNIIRLDDTQFRDLVRESLGRLLSEGEGNMDKCEAKCREYEDILMREYEQAQKDVASARATFHYGIRDAMQRKGYTTVEVHDNSCSFYGPSKLFMFHSIQGTDLNSPWKLHNDVLINASNYAWRERYQYDMYRNVKMKWLLISQFRDVYMKACEELGQPVELQPYKATYQRTDEEKEFLVYKGSSRSFTKIGVYDNFEEAKTVAYNLAKKECDRGNTRRDDTRRYYYSQPHDVTINHPDDFVTYEYYNFDESSFYYGVTKVPAL